MKYIREILAGGVNYVKSNLQSEKIGFSKGGVALQFAPIKFWQVGGFNYVKSNL